jgi:hypothetical protein
MKRLELTLKDHSKFQNALFLINLTQSLIGQVVPLAFKSDIGNQEKLSRLLQSMRFIELDLVILMIELEFFVFKLLFFSC